MEKKGQKNNFKKNKNNCPFLKERGKITFVEDHKNFLKVFLKHQDELRAFINALERQVSAREDLFQEVSLTLMKNFENYDQDLPFNRWAKGVARNVLLNHWKKVGRSKVLFNEEVMEIISESFEKVEKESSSHQKALGVCFEKLPEKSREVLNHKYRDNMSVEEIADKYNGKFEAIKKMLFRLRSKLRHCIELEIASEGVL
jgi:RNA polymerase sigma-70 factor (ECF subfamily)